MAEHIEIGLKGESVAEDYLLSKGWRIVERRWRDHAVKGLKTDVDLIAVSVDGTYHFVEVKTRTHRANICPMGDFSPAAAVTPAKIQRMIQVSERYLSLQSLDAEIVIDLVTVIFRDGVVAPPTICYYTDISR